MKPALLFLSLLLCCVSAIAAPVAWVEAVQMPAWLERSGVRQPLAAKLKGQPGAEQPSVSR
ncbi:MAG TPA: hypothetical protein VLL03_06895 [Burkholderiales bacterium]|nr:hypothetical protein [Burkholderiales bacterium]